MSTTQSNAFESLHHSIKKWIWKQKWDSLRSIQESAIDPILNADKDIVISAATAAGKTEAAFLPICSNIVEADSQSYHVLYVSPLKALINDQERRLRSLFEIIDSAITPWHGDIGQGRKKKSFSSPKGLLLITPESLESLFVNRGQMLKNVFTDLRYVVIDEFHAFIGSER
ncbi:DEAD/DEAH box helicase [Candidatus Bathyarchaeota archaeon]|nr:DEAD/DEAH box helicase [Candidatus Bathyarchaeota archaeon]